MATQASEKVERLLNLVICLLHTRRPLLKEQIRRAVPQYDQESDEAFDRMFERDKDELRTLGIPLRSRVDPVFEDDTGYLIDRSEYALPQIEFTPAEVAALSLAARTWTHAALAGSGAEALRKLAAAGVDTDGAADSTLGIEPRVRAVEPAFDAVHAAVLATQPIAFDYRRSGGSATRRHVQPWGIASWHGRWYLTGYDTDRAAPRVFRLGRIEGAVTTAGRAGSYQVPADHDARSTVRFSVGRTGADADQGTATLLVRAGRAHALRRRAADPDRAAAPDRAARPGAPSGTAAGGQEATAGWDQTWDTITVPYDDAGRFVDELCWYGPDVRVLGPPPVRAAVIARLRAAAGDEAGEAS